MNFRVPREFFPWWNLSQLGYLHLVIAMSLCASLLVFGAVFLDDWDRTNYNVTLLKERLEDENFTATWTDFGGKNVSSVGFEMFFVEEDIIFWDGRGYCSDTKLNINASILLPEHGGVWQMCRAFENDHQRALLTESCGPLADCLNYMFKDEPYQEASESRYCCGGCCAYGTEQRVEMNEAAMTTYEVLYTIISSVIVALIMQCVSYILMVIGYCYQNDPPCSVPVTRITGVTFLVSGIFMGFAIMLNQYKLVQMTSQLRSLPYLPSVVVGVRIVEVGWCAYIGLGAVVSCLIVAFAWIQLSRFLVELANKLPSDPYEVHQKTNSSRPLSAVLVNSVRKLTASANGPATEGKGPAKQSNGLPAITVQEL